MDLGDVAIIGSNPTRIWGMSAAERIVRMARSLGLTVADGPDAHFVANSDFAFDTAWLRYIKTQPNTVLTLGGALVIGHAADSRDIPAIARGGDVDPARFRIIAAEDDRSIVDSALRKREKPFVMRLTEETVRDAERASYFGAYKGVTDILTKYLWPEWALVLTRLAARIGLSPNCVTLIGMALVVAATVAFYHGWYWLGLATGLGSMVLDTVDGKLARCTLTSSRLGNALDHGTDLIHPPIWWWAWGVGLAAYGTPVTQEALVFALIAIVVAYVVQRLIEGAFIAGFGMHIHVWERIDSRFRLITARRNPNMVILFATLLIGRPDLGLLGLAWWSVLSCLFHLVRLGQAYVARSRGRPVRSWLED